MMWLRFIKLYKVSKAVEEVPTVIANTCVVVVVETGTQVKQPHIVVDVIWTVEIFQPEGQCDTEQFQQEG